jgi:fructokinase
LNHDVICLGEALVDFLPDRRGQRVRDVMRWTPCLGGSPANVAVGVARLGGRSGLIGVVGDDEFGHFLHQRLEHEGVDTTFFRHTEQGKTGLGFVSLTSSGERSFTFYRAQAADQFLEERDTKRAASVIAKARVLHINTNSLLHAKARSAVTAVVRRSSRAGRLTSFDPNLRLHLWPNADELSDLLKTLLPILAIVKLSDEEIEFVTGTTDVDEALERLEAHGVILPVVTCGAQGAVFRFRKETRSVPAPRVRVVDTTGAGDGFTSGLLTIIAALAGTRKELAALPIEELEDAAQFACAVGSRVVTKLGAVAGLPTLDDLDGTRLR